MYRHLFNRDLYLMASGKIYADAGALTPGSTPETADDMSLRKIEAIGEAVRQERSRWTPTRRVYIEKEHATKKRPLSMPSWSDKRLHEVIGLILESYYEPHLSECSHGFRPARGGHTALQDIDRTWLGTTWYLEGDVKACFDRLDHQSLLDTLAENIHDGRFLRLVRELLQAGYLAEWNYNVTLSGAPQGGIVGPLLSNISLTRLDKYIEHTLIAAYTKGSKRQPNPKYTALLNEAARLRRKGQHQEAHEVRTCAQQLPSVDPDDPEYRRMRYVRYADDWLVGFIGPRAEVEEIKRQIGTFLRDELKPTLSCERYLKNGKPIQRKEQETETASAIMTRYQAEYGGLVEYYQMANNLNRLNALRWVMEVSLTKTRAAKFKLTVPKVYDRFPTTHLVDAKTRTNQAEERNHDGCR